MSKFTVHTGALRTMADSCTAAARAVESVCADLPPAARTLADRLESDTAALRRLVRHCMSRPNSAPLPTNCVPWGPLPRPGPAWSRPPRIPPRP